MRVETRQKQLLNVVIVLVVAEINKSCKKNSTPMEVDFLVLHALTFIRTIL